MSIIYNLHLLRTFAFAVMASLLCLQGAAATFSLNPDADAFVVSRPFSNLDHNNYGAAGALSVAASNLPQGEFQSVLRFSLAGAKSSFDSQFGASQWTIQSVTLQLTATTPGNPIFNASAAGQFTLSWMQNDSWIEGTGTPQLPQTAGITFSTLSNFVGLADENLGTFSYNGATSGNFSYTLSLTPLFSADVLAGSTASFRMVAADTTVSYVSDSRNFGTAAARPLLTITAVPEPNSFALGLLSLWVAVRFRTAFRSRRP